jgi:hypothetical protein
VERSHKVDDIRLTIQPLQWTTRYESAGIGTRQPKQRRVSIIGGKEANRQAGQSGGSMVIDREFSVLSSAMIQVCRNIIDCNWP